MFYYLEKEINDYENAGRYSNNNVPKFYNKIKEIVHSKNFGADPLEAISTRPIVDQYSKVLNIEYKREYFYVSPFISDEEIELENQYELENREFDNEYWKRKRELHFNYLDQKLKEVKLIYGLNEEKKKNPFKSVLFIIYAIHLGLILLGIPGSLKELFESSESAVDIIVRIVALFIFIGLLLIPFFITLKLYRNWKKKK